MAIDLFFQRTVVYIQVGSLTEISLSPLSNIITPAQRIVVEEMDQFHPLKRETALDIARRGWNKV